MKEKEVKQPIIERCEKCHSILSAKCPYCGYTLKIYENGEYMICYGCNRDFHVEV